MKNLFVYGVPIFKFKIALVALYVLIGVSFIGISKPSFAEAQSLQFHMTKLGLSLEVNPSESRYGDRLTLKATVEGYQPTGKVVFYEGENILSEMVLTTESNGVAIFSWSSYLSAGMHILRARYFSDQHPTVNDTAEVSVKISRAASAVTFPKAAYTAILGHQFDSPVAVTTGSTGVLRYSSSNQEVAIVEPETGVLTVLKPGSATVTAAIAADTNYAAATASYSLIVGVGGVQFVPGSGTVAISPPQNI